LGSSLPPAELLQTFHRRDEGFLPKRKTLGKEGFLPSAKKTLGKIFESVFLALGKESTLSSVFFVECFSFGTRQRSSLPSVKKTLGKPLDTR